MISSYTQRRPDQWKYEPQTLGGQRVIVTGGTTGIGRTTALLLASLGARVLIFGRHEPELRDAMAAMNDYADRVTGLTADQAREDDLDRVFQHADEQFGGLDVLINNAGLPAGGVESMDPDQYRYVVETNLLGYIACAKRALPRLRDAGGGTIINVGSLSARGKEAGSDVYVATKAALRGFSASLAKQVQNDHIRVTLLEPGSTGSDLDESTPPEEERRLHDRGEGLFSEAVAEAVLWCLMQPAHVLVPTLQDQPIGEPLSG